MTAFSDRPVSADPKAVKDALRRLANLCRDLDREAPHADLPERAPDRIFPPGPEDFPHPHCPDLDDILGEEPLLSRLRAGSSPYFE